MATKVHGDLSRQSVLVIGAGETGSLVGKLLAKEHPADLVVINRTEERARLLAEGLGGRVRSFDQLPDALGEADVVVTATASTEPIIRPADLDKAMMSRGRKPLVIVDIASPRDVEPAVAECDDVFLYDLDSLQSIVEQNRAQRRSIGAFNFQRRSKQTIKTGWHVLEDQPFEHRHIVVGDALVA